MRGVTQAAICHVSEFLFIDFLGVYSEKIVITKQNTNLFLERILGHLRELPSVTFKNYSQFFKAKGQRF